MWRAEKRQPLFHLLGSAFSKIRDQCSNPPPLDRFLDVASRIVSIIPAQKYLELSGWTIVDQGDDKTIAKVDIDEAMVTSRYPLQSNASPQDIIRYCFHQGLISSMPQPIVAPRAQPRPTMSFAALPQDHDLEASVQSQTPAQSTTDPGDISAFFDFNDFPATPQYSPSMNEVTLDQQLAMQSTPGFAHWHPEIQPPILGFDPSMLQDDFDPFSFESGFLTNA